MRKSLNGLTLIEVIVAISLASMLTAGLEQLMSTALTSWRIAVEDAAISSLSEDTMKQLLEGDYDFPGIKDAVEVLTVEENLLAFVPLWIDEFELIPKDGRFYLTKHMKPGSPPPLAEVKFPQAEEFGTYFVTVETDESGKAWVSFGFPLQKGAVVRLSYHPDMKFHPELAMTYHWDISTGGIVRSYNGRSVNLNLRRTAINATALKFEYYGGNNRPVDITGKKLSKKNSLIRITAVKIYMTLQGADMKKETTSFVNIRALGKAGQGVILEEGLDIPVPSSKNIHLMQLLNFTGVDEGQVIEFKVSAPKKNQTWRLKLFLGVESGVSILRRYEIYFPIKKMVEERDSEVNLKNGLDLLTLSQAGVYDYDEDEDVTDLVHFEGSEITLSVLRSDPEGVMLIVRP